ncbi:MAG: hypothetical protein IIC60_01755 [Proteobacteria bacterium]|nr:hypothetical protein [Pseudomonadota bacterium]
MATNDANVFDRVSLQFTVKLLRIQHPTLALRVQNIIAPAIVKESETAAAPQPSDLFSLALDTNTLKRVVETLAAAGQELAEQVLLQTEADDPGHLLAMKEIIGKWLLYARQHQSSIRRVARPPG